jgi:RNA polymerase sigma factor (sigma-70 family)
VYLENQGVFQGVFARLRQLGFTIQKADEDELLHEFLTQRLPRALETFRPERGELKTWLSVVFRRFVIGRYRQRQRHEELLGKFAGSMAHVEIDPARHVDVARVRAHVEHLPEEEQQALSVYFGEKPSLRAVARALKIPRWRADDLVWTAVARVVLAMDANVGVPEQALRRCVDPDPSQRRTRQEVQRTLKALLGNRASVTGEEKMLESNESIEQPRPGEPKRALSCDDLDAFLAGRRQVSSPGAARAILRHAAACETCASRLQEHELHVEALLAAARVEAESGTEELDEQAAADAVVAAEQRELLVVARAVCETLTEDERENLERCGELTPEHRADLWMLDREEPRVADVLFRLALAVTEATLSLSTISSSKRNADGRVVLEEDHVRFWWLVDGEKESKDVPSSYFAHQIAGRADLPAELARAVWSAFIKVAVDGQVGVPGFHLEKDAGRSYLILGD